MGMSDFKQVVDVYRALERIEKKLRRLDVLRCLQGLSERQEERAEKLEKQAKDVAKILDLEVKHERDPRGATLWVYSGAEGYFESRMAI